MELGFCDGKWWEELKTPLQSSHRPSFPGNLWCITLVLSITAHRAPKRQQQTLSNNSSYSTSTRAAANRHHGQQHHWGQHRAKPHWGAKPHWSQPHWGPTQRFWRRQWLQQQWTGWRQYSNQCAQQPRAPHHDGHAECWPSSHQQHHHGQGLRP